jgi:hypothetical protein
MKFSLKWLFVLTFVVAVALAVAPALLKSLEMRRDIIELKRLKIGYGVGPDGDLTRPDSRLVTEVAQ